MTRPTVDPLWGTDANLNDPGEDWDGTPTRVTPSSGEREAGFLPGTAPAAQVHNFLFGNHGDWLNYFDPHVEFVRHDKFIFSDDFDRAAVASTMWSSISGSPTVTTDYTSGGWWAATLQPTTGNSIAVRSAGLPWGANDFHFFARVRVGTFAGTSNVSVYPAGTELYFKVTNGGNWQCGVATVDNNSGVAHSATYQDLEIIRLSNVVYFYIDGDLVHSEAYSTSNTAPLTGFEANAVGGNCELFVDAIKFAAVR
jgi:hypothetical protein